MKIILALHSNHAVGLYQIGKCCCQNDAPDQSLQREKKRREREKGDSGPSKHQSRSRAILIKNKGFINSDTFSK